MPSSMPPPLPAAPPPPQAGPIPGAPSPAAIKEAHAWAAWAAATGKPIPLPAQKILEYEYAGPAAAATTQAQEAAKAPFARQQAEYQAQLTNWVNQNKPEVMREGSVYVGPDGVKRYNPAIVKTTDPKTGQEYQWARFPATTPGESERYEYIGPIGMTPRAGAQEKAGGEAAGQHEPLQQSPTTGPQPGATPRTGWTVPVAPGMTSKQPDYQEPSYNPTQLQANQERWGKTNGEIAASYGVSQQAETRLMTIADAFKQINTGAWQTEKAAWNNALDAIYGKEGGPQWLRTSTDAGAVYTALHEAQKSTIQMLKATNPRFANAEFQTLTKAGESPDLPAAANLNMLAEDIATVRQQMAFAHDWAEARIGDPRMGVAPKQDIDIYETKWFHDNQLGPIKDAVKKEIGPLGTQPQVREGQTVYDAAGKPHIIDKNGKPVPAQQGP